MLNSSVAPWPSYTEEEQQAVARVLQSGRVNYWTGDEGRQFEREFAEWAGTAPSRRARQRHGGARPGAEGAGHRRGRRSRHDAADVHRIGLQRRDWPARPGLRRRRPRQPEHHRRDDLRACYRPEPRAIICRPHRRLAVRHGPDRGARAAARAASHRGLRAGARRPLQGPKVGTFGDVGAWSFCQDKIITTGGEGGMVTTDGEELWSRMWSYKDHGKSWDAVYERQHPPGFRWLHETSAPTGG